MRTGAAQVVVTDGSDLSRAVLDTTGGNGADVVLDHVGGALLPRLIPAIAVHGTLVSVGRMGGDSATVDLAALSARQLHLVGVSYSFTDPDLIGDALDALESEVLPLISAGAVRPVIADVLGFEQAPEALNRLRVGTEAGKFVLSL